MNVRGSRWQMFFKIVFVKNFAIFTGKQCYQCYSLFLISCRPSGFIIFIKETPAQLFSCEYFEIFMNTFFTEHLGWLLLQCLLWEKVIQIPLQECTKWIVICKRTCLKLFLKTQSTNALNLTDIRRSYDILNIKNIYWGFSREKSNCPYTSS